jgi:hypothetical protein
MNSLITPWLDFYLKGDCSGFSAFETAAAAPGLVLTSNCNYEPIDYEVTATNATNGQNNGSALVSTTGGAFPVDLTWFDGSNNPEITGLGAGIYEFTITDAYCSLTGSVTILDATSNVVDHLLNQFQIAPNPIKEWVTLSFSSENEKTIQIFDVTGKLLHTSVSQDSEISINLGSINSGVYFVVVQNQNGIKVTKRLIKD